MKTKIKTLILIALTISNISKTNASGYRAIRSMRYFNQSHINIDINTGISTSLKQVGTSYGVSVSRERKNTWELGLNRYELIDIMKSQKFNIDILHVGYRMNVMSNRDNTRKISMGFNVGAQFNGRKLNKVSMVFKPNIVYCGKITKKLGFKTSTGLRLSNNHGGNGLDVGVGLRLKF